MSRLTRPPQGCCTVYTTSRGPLVGVEVTVPAAYIRLVVELHDTYTTTTHVQPCGWGGVLVVVVVWWGEDGAGGNKRLPQTSHPSNTLL